MKNSVKTLLFGVMLLPCAFLFVGCGGNNMTPEQNYVDQSFQAASEFFVNENLDNYKDVTYTITNKSSEEAKIKLKYKATADATSLTENEFTNIGTYDSTVTVTRYGKSANAKIKIDVNNTMIAVDYSVSEEDQTLVYEKTTDKELETYYFGIVKIQDVDTLVYMVDSKKYSYNDDATEEQKNTPVETTKAYKVLGNTTELNKTAFEQNNSENISQLLKNAFYGITNSDPCTDKFTYSAEGDSVTLNIKSINSTVEINNNDSTIFDIYKIDYNRNFTFKNNAMKNVEYTVYVEGAESEKMSMKANLAVTMSATAFNLPELTDYTEDNSLIVHNIDNFTVF